jgi:hypothetical protein
MPVRIYSPQSRHRPRYGPSEDSFDEFVYGNNFVVY